MASRRKLVLSLALGSLLTLVVASSALGTHARPGSGSPVRVPLVPSYKICNPPFDSTHVAPLILPSCTTANPQFGLNSGILTMGTGGAGAGFIKLTVFCDLTLPGSTETVPPCTFGDGQEEEDIKIDLFASDVKCQVANQTGTNGCPAAGDDYTGQLIGQSPIRITDHSSGGPTATCTTLSGAGCTIGTTFQTNFSVPTEADPDGAGPMVGSCVPTVAAAGSQCNFSSSINAVVAGAVKEGQRGIVSIFGLKVLDAGLDGDVGAGCPPVCGTADEGTFLDQGIFLP